MEYRFNSKGRKEAYVYVDDDSDSEFITLVVSMLRYEINNERVQKDWCRDSLDDDKFKNYPSPDSTEDAAFRNLDAKALKAAVEKLKPDEQFIINRIHFDSNKTTQVLLAKELGITTFALCRRIAGIMIKLKNILEEHGAAEI